MPLSRLKNTFKAGQDPIDRLWSVTIVLSVLVFLLGGAVVESRMFSNESRHLSYQRGSVDCLSVLVDNDRTFGMPTYCRSRGIVVHYPPQVCEDFFVDRPYCGVEWED